MLFLVVKAYNATLVELLLNRVGPELPPGALKAVRAELLAFVRQAIDTQRGTQRGLPHG